MSQLIDSYTDTQSEQNGVWNIAKPLNPFFLKQRIKDSWKVFRGESVAVHFKQSEN